MLTFRRLPPDEWPRLLEAGIEPFATVGLPDPAHWILVAAEMDGRIVGVSSLVETVQNHWHIAPAARRSAAVVVGLWRETEAVLTEHGVTVLHATVADDQPEVQAMVERLGYQAAHGKLYVLHVPDAILSGR